MHSHISRCELNRHTNHVVGLKLNTWSIFEKKLKNATTLPIAVESPSVFILHVQQISMVYKGDLFHICPSLVRDETQNIVDCKFLKSTLTLEVHNDEENKLYASIGNVLASKQLPYPLNHSEIFALLKVDFGCAFHT